MSVCAEYGKVSVSMCVSGVVCVCVCIVISCKVSMKELGRRNKCIYEP